MGKLTGKGALGESVKDHRQLGSLQFHEAPQEEKRGSTDKHSSSICNDSERMARKRMKAAEGQEDRTTQTGKRGL